MTRRNIVPNGVFRKAEPVTPAANLHTWLVEQATTKNLTWLLAHTDNGVIWGYIGGQEQSADNGGWMLAWIGRRGNRDQPPANQLFLSCDDGPLARGDLSLDLTSFQQLRLFGPDAELFLWRAYTPNPAAPPQLEGRLFRDTVVSSPNDDTPNVYDYFDEDYLLWGWGNEEQAGFVTLVEGTQGIVHSPPLAAPVTEGSRAALTVRHYLTPDEEGLVQVVGNRLVGLKAGKERADQ